MRTKRIIVVDQEEYDHGQFIFDGKLNDVIDAFVSVLKKIPEEYRDVATCEISTVSGYEGSSWAHISVEYERPMTPEENADEDARNRQQEQRREEELRRQYETLKAKFGS